MYITDKAMLISRSFRDARLFIHRDSTNTSLCDRTLSRKAKSSVLHSYKQSCHISSSPSVFYVCDMPMLEFVPYRFCKIN